MKAMLSAGSGSEVGDRLARFDGEGQEPGALFDVGGNDVDRTGSCRILRIDKLPDDLAGGACDSQSPGSLRS